MGVANTKSNAVTNADATPKVMTNPFVAGGNLKSAVGFVEVAAADDDNSIYRFIRVPSNARMQRLEIFNDAITGGTDYNIGLWNTAARSSGAVADENIFADAVSMASARVAPLDVLFHTNDIINVEKRLWELLGLTSDPGIEYDIAMIGITVGTGAGHIMVRADWTV